jgi:hypothetical protein
MEGSACNCGTRVVKNVLIPAAVATRSIRRNALKLGYSSALSQNVVTSFVMLNVYTSKSALEPRRRADLGRIQATELLLLAQRLGEHSQRARQLRQAAGPCMFWLGRG